MHFVIVTNVQVQSATLSLRTLALKVCRCHRGIHTAVPSIGLRRFANYICSPQCAMRCRHSAGSNLQDSPALLASQSHATLLQWTMPSCVGAWQQRAASRQHDGARKQGAMHFKDVLSCDDGGFRHVQASTSYSFTGTPQTPCGARASFSLTVVFRGWQRTASDSYSLPSYVYTNATQSLTHTNNLHNK